MARRSRDEDLLMEDELTAAFLGEDDFDATSNPVVADDDQGAAPVADDWDEEDAVPGQLAVDVYETKERALEAKRKTPLVSLDLFKISDFTRGLIVRFLHVSLIAGATFAVPLFLQVTYGLNAFQTGLILLGLTAGLLTTALGGTRVGLQYLPKQKVRWGFLIAILGLAIIAAYVMNGDNPAGMLPGLFVYGAGLGLIASQIVNLVLSAVSPKQTAEASGVTSTLETLGSSVGTALVGTALVVALTSGITKLVPESTVFSEQDKTKISENMQASVEVVSNEVVSEEIHASPEYEEEAIRIYDQARQDAFVVTLMFMAFIALVAYLSARSLPNTRTSESAV